MRKGGQGVVVKILYTLMRIRLIVFMTCIMTLFSCAGTRPKTLGLTSSGLSPCPHSPNCVSSESIDSTHAIKPFDLVVPGPEAWKVVRAAVSALPRTQIVTETKDYLHAECRSAIIGFVDDLELHLILSQGIISVRSASRVGYSDFGVNRRRVERLRLSLVERGVVR